MHGLMDTPVFGDEPKVDHTERSEDTASDAGLLLHLADRRILGGLTFLKMTLGQGPDEAAPAVVPRNQRRAQVLAGAIDHESAG